MRKILQSILQFLAKRTIARYRPAIVAITGNVGKTSTKEAIAVVLGRAKRVRMSGGNLNNEIGVPLAILGDWADEYYHDGPSAGFWLKVVLKGALGLVIPQRYPEILVLEYGADKPKDIESLARDFKPHVAVVTAVGEIPVHVEFFANPEGLAREKAKLVEALEPGDHAVLNYDDQTVLDMRDKTAAQVHTFGLADEAQVHASNLDILMNGQGKPEGMVFKLSADGKLVPVKIYGSLGTSQATASAAAAAVGFIFGLNLVEISEALVSYRGPKGRLRILDGIRGSTILDDTYNASPASMHLALETLQRVQGTRKIAVLGNMLELGKYTPQAHETVGNLAATVADVLICVGDKAKLIADAAENGKPSGNIYAFHTSDEARPLVQRMIREGDVVLVKGSQSMRMEKIVEEIMAHPERKKELLVRQSKKWLNI